MQMSLLRKVKSLHTTVPFVFFSVLSALLIVLAACTSSSPTNTQSKYTGNIKVGLSSDILTLDPLKSAALVDRQVMFNIYDTLVRVNQQNTIEPDLATSWSYLSPTQLVFTLRTDVKFQDGTRFDANAVVFNINRILSDKASPRHSEISAVKSVAARDSSHVEFTLKQPFSPLLATLTDRAGMMLSPTAVQKLGANLSNNAPDAGSGPFIFVNWVKGDHLTLKRNPHYWMKDSQGNALPYLQSIIYHPIVNGSVMYSNLETGTINAADSVDPNNVATARSNSSLVYKQIPGLSFYGMMLNTKASPLDNVHVRRAIEWSVNRQEIVANVLKGIGTVAQGPLAASSWAYDNNFAPYSYNINKAKAELALGNHPNGITFTLIVGSGSPLLTQEAQFLQSELQPAGITLEIKQETSAAQLNDTETHNFQAALLLWSGRPDPDGNMYAWFHTGGGFNWMQYSNPHVDALLEAARTSSDQAQRMIDYQQAQQLLLQDAPFVFINHGVSVQATTNKVKNFPLRPIGILDFTQVYSAA